MLGKFTAAAVQLSPVLPFDKEKTVDVVCEAIAEAADNGAKLIVFPECFVPMYPNWSIDLQDETGWAMNLREFTYNSILIPGPETKRIGEVARDKGVYVVVGANEVEEVYDGALFNSLVFIGPTGEVLGKHRKLFPSNREKVFHARGDASGAQDLRHGHRKARRSYLLRAPPAATQVRPHLSRRADTLCRLAGMARVPQWPDKPARHRRLLQGPCS